jgi:hypothetical protein
MQLWSGGGGGKEEIDSEPIKIFQNFGRGGKKSGTFLINPPPPPPTRMFQNASESHTVYSLVYLLHV